MISFEVPLKEAALISKIVVRAASLLGGFERIELAMDLTAVQANGCPLKLRELLDADKCDFCHDIVGIQRHLNRRTGMLGDCFTPRFTASRQWLAARKAKGAA